MKFHNYCFCLFEVEKKILNRRSQRRSSKQKCLVKCQWKQLDTYLDIMFIFMKARGTKKFIPFKNMVVYEKVGAIKLINIPNRWRTNVRAWSLSISSQINTAVNVRRKEITLFQCQIVTIIQTFKCQMLKISFHFLLFILYRRK